MRKSRLFVISAVLLLSGCSDNKLPPMKQLPPLDTTAKTTSDYTGTTVDFIHVEINEPSLPAGSSDYFSIPDFPDFPVNDNGDDPFGEEFQALFTSVTATPSVSDSEITSGTESYTADTGDGNIQTISVNELFPNNSDTVDPSQTSAVTADVSFSTEGSSEINNDMHLQTDVIGAETAINTELPDIAELMPDFNTIDQLY